MITKLDYPFTVFELTEGVIYQKFRTQNQHGRKLFKRIGNELFEANDMTSEWTHNFNVRVKDRFKAVIGSRQTNYKGNQNALHTNSYLFQSANQPSGRGL